MKLRLLMYDVAREQAPTLDHLRGIARLAEASGFTGLGLYLEHRFAYPSIPWSHGNKCVTPAMIQALEAEFPNLEIVPFINLLGHVEGFIYCEEGSEMGAEPLAGLQASEGHPGFQELARQILADTLNCFRSQLIHIGGDETSQLDSHPRDKAAIAGYVGDGKAKLFADHFEPLCRQVLAAGRTPGIWADMLLAHPDALVRIPRETLLFDWQYFNGVKETAAKMVEAGFQVVACPTLHIYNAAWMHLNKSDENVREVSLDAQEMDLAGVCLTTWEYGCFGAWDTYEEVVRGCGKIMADPVGTPTLLEHLKTVDQGEWAELVGVKLEELGGVFAFMQRRSSLKSRLLLTKNPFLLWLHHREELCGPTGDAALEILDRAMQAAPGEAEKGVTHFIRSAIEFVRLSEQARIHYAAKEPEKAVAVLAPTRHLFDTLEMVAKRSESRTGGSLADRERCRAAKAHVETVLHRIRTYGDGSLGYLPAWKIITHPRFVPHDQGCWWLINRWVNE